MKASKFALLLGLVSAALLGCSSDPKPVEGDAEITKQMPTASSESRPDLDARAQQRAAGGRGRLGAQ